MKHTYVLENLNCAHCASKIEAEIAKTDGYESVSFNFATKHLNFYSDRKNTLSEIQHICDSIEDGVNVVEFSEKSEKSDNKKASMLNLDTVLLIISAILGVCAFVLHLAVPESIEWSEYLIFALSITATLLSGYKIFIKGIKNALKLRIDETTLLTVAVTAAFFLGEFVEAAMVTVLFSLGEFIEDKAVDASRKDIEKLAQIRPDTATVLVNGSEKTMSAESIEIGSTIIVKPYERIPLDGIVTEGTTAIDTSALTGESLPVDVSEGSEVLSGSINGSNLIKIRTTKEFGDSTATRILRLVEDAAAQKGKREKLISRFASVYTPIIIAIAVAIAVVPPLLGLGEFSEWLYRALVCLVASCPCAIVISVPLSYFSGIGAASETGILIKGGKYIEALAKSDTFVFDKTGTLTNGKLSVEKVTSLSDYSEDEILALASACEKHSVHPIAVAIKEKATNLKVPELSDYSEKAGYGTSASYNGKKLECGSMKLLDEKQKALITDNATVFLTENGKLIGSIAVSDTVRDEAENVIAELKKLGIKNTVMLTGDSEKTAEAVSKKLGIDSYKANLLPSEKLDAVISLKENAKGICFTGDGINDAPVLSASDCGIAMGLGSEAAIEASDAVLASGNLSQLPNAVKISRRVLNTVRTNIIFALTIKALVIILATFGIASMWMSVIADTGVSVACVLYSARLRHRRDDGHKSRI